MSDNIEVTVEVPDAPPVETPDAAPVVVVVEDDAPAPEAAPAAVVDHEGRLARIEMQLEATAAALEALASGTRQAQDTADVAVEVAVEAAADAAEAAEGEQPPASDDVAPNNEHWFFK